MIVGNTLLAWISVVNCGILMGSSSRSSVHRVSSVVLDPIMVMVTFG